MEIDFKIWEIFLNKTLIASLCAQLTSQLYKVFVFSIKNKKIEIAKINSYGGMPSAHTAFISAAIFSIGLNSGWKSDVFALAVVFAGILITDIIVVRGSLVKQIKATEKILEKIDVEEDIKIPQLKDHKFLDIIVGIIWGILVAFFVNFLFSR